MMISQAALKSCSTCVDEITGLISYVSGYALVWAKRINRIHWETALEGMEHGYESIGRLHWQAALWIAFSGFRHWVVCIFLRTLLGMHCRSG